MPIYTSGDQFILEMRIDSVYHTLFGLLVPLGISFYLGVAKEKKEQLKAHAWLRCGRQVVCGERGMARYTVIATFGG